MTRGAISTREQRSILLQAASNACDESRDALMQASVADEKLWSAVDALRVSVDYLIQLERGRYALGE